MKRALFFLLALTAQGWANDTAMHDGGSGPEPVGWSGERESVIRMVSEEVHVEMGPTESYVVCRFDFVNVGKDSPAMQYLGFPDITRSSTEGDTMPPLREMRSFVNGREVSSKLVSKRLGEDGKWIDLEKPSDPCETWHVITVTFPPNEHVIVERRFRTDNGQTAGGPIFFGYTTQTGGNWRSTIGKATFTVHLAEGMQSATLQTDPSDQWQRSKDGRTLTLVWSDFEPRTDTEHGYWSVGWMPAKPMEGPDEVLKKLKAAYQP